jgi:hypothetical protein
MCRVDYNAITLCKTVRTPYSCGGALIWNSKVLENENDRLLNTIKHYFHPFANLYIPTLRSNECVLHFNFYKIKDTMKQGNTINENQPFKFNC